MQEDALLTLTIGTLSGVVFQFVSMMYYLNGTWAQVSIRKKFATVLGGGLSAVLVGLWVLSDADAPPTAYKLWFLQSVAGLAGFAFLDVARNGFLRMVKQVFVQPKPPGGE